MPIDTHITINVSSSWKKDVTKYARQVGVSRSKFVRDAVRAAICEGAAPGQIDHVYPPEQRINGHCNPRARVGLCSVCWSSTPTREEWDIIREAPQSTMADFQGDDEE